MSVPELPPVRDDDLAELEHRVGAALARGDADGLRVLGHGEVTLVLGWPEDQPVVACKRLPVFRDEAAATAYGELVEEYLDVLADRGVHVVPSTWRTTPTARGGPPEGSTAPEASTASEGSTVSGWVLQPALDPDDLAPRRLAAHPEEAGDVFGAILDLVTGVVDVHVGLDAQLSNWAVVDGGLVHLDVTTPLLADGTGRTRLDVRLLTATLPAVLRPAVRRFVAPGLVAAYHRPRDTAVDLVGNLLKERLDHLVPVALEEANSRVSPPVTVEEVQRWYRSDARTWEVLLRLRRADRWWQRNVRRRTYPFLLPPPIER